MKGLYRLELIDRIEGFIDQAKDYKTVKLAHGHFIYGPFQHLSGGIVIKEHYICKTVVISFDLVKLIIMDKETKGVIYEFYLRRKGNRFRFYKGC